jgi:hypothetical protein
MKLKTWWFLSVYVPTVCSDRWGSARDREIHQYLDGGCRVSRKDKNIRDNVARYGLCATSPNGDPTGVQFTSSVRGSQFIPLSYGLWV